VLERLANEGLHMLQRYQATAGGCKGPADLVAALRMLYPSAGGSGPAALGAAADAAPPISLSALGADAARLFSRAHGAGCMLGPLADAARARAARVRRARAPVQAEVRPAEGAAALPAAPAAAQETDALVTGMRRILSGLPQGTRVPVVLLVLSHDSLAHTLENLFALSFLVK
jgi:hypothetical protein